MEIPCGLICVDDNLLVRAGLVTLLGGRGHQVVAVASGPASVPALVRTHAPDVVLVDIRMPPTAHRRGAAARGDDPGPAPGSGRARALAVPRRVLRDPAARAVAGTRRLPPQGQRPAHRGARRRDRRVAAGGTFVDPELVDLLVRSDSTLDVLSDREREVLRLMAEGLSDRGIAQALTVGLSTVYTHVQHVFAKLDLPATPSDNRRVRAVVAYLASEGADLTRAGSAPRLSVPGERLTPTCPTTSSTASPPPPPRGSGAASARPRPPRRVRGRRSAAATTPWSSRPPGRARPCPPSSGRSTGSPRSRCPTSGRRAAGSSTSRR